MSFGENINSQEEEHKSTNAYFRPIMVHYVVHTAPIIIYLEMQLIFYPKRNMSDDICPDLYKVEAEESSKLISESANHSINESISYDQIDQNWHQ